MKKIKALIDLIRPPGAVHIFPFAICGAYWCIGKGETPDLFRLFLLCLALVCGFYAGNCINGMTDIKIDEINPRTLTRPLVTGALKIWEALAFAVLCLALVVICAFVLNPIYVLLLPIPVGIGIFYSFSKRFTALCHCFLGLTSGVAPVSAWIVFGNWLDPRLLLAGAIAFFHTVGYDTIYSTADVEYDKEKGMHSIPVAFGIQGAYRIAFVCYLFTLGCGIALGIAIGAGWLYYLGLALAEPILLIQFRWIKSGQNEDILRAFLVNKYYGIVLMVFTLLDHYI